MIKTEIAAWSVNPMVGFATLYMNATLKRDSIPMISSSFLIMIEYNTGRDGNAIVGKTLKLL